MLQPEVCGRASLTFGGSQEPDSLSCSGTREACLPVLVARLAELAQGNGGLGDTQRVADPCFRGGPIEEILQAICIQASLACIGAVGSAQIG